MAFDWTKVEGYKEEMTPEEKLALLDNYNDPEPAPKNDPAPAPTPDPKNDPAPAPKGGMVSKAQFDKVSSELAAVKKQLRGKMTEDEAKELERQQHQEEMETELNNLRREKALAGYKASYLSQGYDEQLAEEAATAMVDGDMETVFAVMKKQSVNAEKAMRAKILKETPVPPASDDPNDEKKKQEEQKKLRGYFGLPT